MQPPRASSGPASARWKRRGACFMQRACTMRPRRRPRAPGTPRRPTALQRLTRWAGWPQPPPNQPIPRRTKQAGTCRTPSVSRVVTSARRGHPPAVAREGMNSSLTSAAPRRMHLMTRPPRPSAGRWRGTRRQTRGRLRRQRPRRRHFILKFQDKARFEGLTGSILHVSFPDLALIGDQGTIWEGREAAHSMTREISYAHCPLLPFAPPT